MSLTFRYGKPGEYGVTMSTASCCLSSVMHLLVCISCAMSPEAAANMYVPANAAFHGLKAQQMGHGLWGPDGLTVSVD